MAERVLITGARAAAALDLARDFAAAGFEVHLADCSPALIARTSRSAQRVHRYPSPVFAPLEFRTAISALVDQIDPVLIVPACEEVFHLAAPALRPAIGSRLFAPPLTVLRRLHDKLAFAQDCAANGILVPESTAFSCREYFSGAAEDWVFKPRFTRFGEDALIGPSAAKLSTLPCDGTWLAQRRVRGTEVCFHAVARNGQMTAFAAYRSAWRLGGGASFAFEPLPRSEAEPLHAIARSLAAAHSITGQFACDAIIDEAGAPWLIECNPRATSGVHLLAHDGLLARAIVAGHDEVHAPQAAPAHLAPAMLVYGLPEALRSGRLHEWRRTMGQGRDVLTRRDDPWPLLGALADAARFTIHGWRHGTSASAATTRDIEWNGEDLP